MHRFALHFIVPFWKTGSSLQKIFTVRFLLSFFLFLSLEAAANDTTKLYNPAAAAKVQIATAVAKAKAEGKHVLIQVGGNWCIWCYRFHDFVAKDSSLSRVLNDKYVVVHLNYSPENKNLPTLKELGYPQRFGFPVFVVLDAKGTRLHTQDSSLLEEGKGYNAGKVKSFFEAWSPAALDEKQYKN